MPSWKDSLSRRTAFRKVLTRRMAELGLSVEAFAAIAHVQAVTANKWLKGRSLPPRGRMPAIAAALQMAPADLIAGLPDPAAQRIPVPITPTTRAGAAALGKRITAYLTTAGRTSTDLAAELGVAGATITHWRQGRMMPSPDLKLRLAALMGVPVEELTRPEPDEAEAMFLPPRIRRLVHDLVASLQGVALDTALEIRLRTAIQEVLGAPRPSQPSSARPTPSEPTPPKPNPDRKRKPIPRVKAGVID